MGLDLNFSETDLDGEFELARPEMVLMFWCTGFRPVVYPLSPKSPRVEVILEKA